MDGKDVTTAPTAAGFARGLQREVTEEKQVEVGVALIQQLIEGCDHAGVMMVDGGRFVTTATTDAVVVRGDMLQYELNEGPCLDSVRDQHTVLSLDLDNEARWPRWAPQMVRDLGIRSMLSLLLYSDRRSFGALNLYSERRHAFGPDDLILAPALATHLALAMAASREITHLGVALTNRTVIGQAEGILMERFGLDADQAFSYLRRTSQEQNRKLVQIAAELVQSRQLPDPGTAERADT